LLIQIQTSVALLKREGRTGFDLKQKVCKNSY